MSNTGDETLHAEVIALISRLHKREVTDDTHLVKDLKLDSLDIAELVAEMEDHFNAVIPMERFSEIRTVGDISRSLSSLIKYRDQAARSA